MGQKPKCKAPISGKAFADLQAGTPMSDEQPSRAATLWEMTLNMIVPYRARALKAEAEVDKQREKLTIQAERMKENADRQFEEDYGKPNNYGGFRGFILTAVNIKDIEVVWDNEAAIVRFGDRRIAPRFKEWLDNHRDALPADAARGKESISVNGRTIKKGDLVWIAVNDKRQQVQMRITDFPWLQGEHWLKGWVPPKDGRSKIVTRGRSDRMTCVHWDSYIRHALADPNA